MESAADRACALVGNMLAAGPRDAAGILAAAEGDKVSARTIQRAAIALGVTKTKAGFGAGWVWRLPADDGGAVNEPAEQPAPGVVNDGSATVHKFLNREIPPPPDAKVIAARLRRLEEIRGMKGPFYAQDSRIQAWVQAGIRDPDLREAYERARTDHSGMLTAGIMDKYVFEVMREAA
ncbi:MAG: hypothetical protein IPH41_01975 [Sulfuritalea sp.]|jgi:hypothetical protein|nr:hypothetical protein [Sulfuritalea sp.]